MRRPAARAPAGRGGGAVAAAASDITAAAHPRPLRVHCNAVFLQPLLQIVAGRIVATFLLPGRSASSAPLTRGRQSLLLVHIILIMLAHRSSVSVARRSTGLVIAQSAQPQRVIRPRSAAFNAIESAVAAPCSQLAASRRRRLDWAPCRAADTDQELVGEDAAAFDVSQQSLQSWGLFFFLLTSVLGALYLVWVKPGGGLAENYLSVVESASGEGQAAAGHRGCTLCRDPGVGAHSSCCMHPRRQLGTCTALARGVQRMQPATHIACRPPARLLRQPQRPATRRTPQTPPTAAPPQAATRRSPSWPSWASSGCGTAAWRACAPRRRK